MLRVTMFVLGMGWVSTSPVEHSGVCVPLSLVSPGSICAGVPVSLSCCTWAVLELWLVQNQPQGVWFGPGSAWLLSPAPAAVPVAQQSLTCCELRSWAWFSPGPGALRS